MPSAGPPPVPISSTWAGGTGIGSITFDKDLDEFVPVVLSDIRRGLGALASRIMVNLVLVDPNTIAIVTEALGTGDPIPTGWQYLKNTGWLRGVDGAEVASFTGLEDPSDI